MVIAIRLVLGGTVAPAVQYDTVAVLAYAVAGRMSMCNTKPVTTVSIPNKTELKEERRAKEVCRA